MPRKNIPNFSPLLLFFFLLNKNRIPQHNLRLKGCNGICHKKIPAPRFGIKNKLISLNKVEASTLMNPMETISMESRVEK